MKKYLCIYCSCQFDLGSYIPTDMKNYTISNNGKTITLTGNIGWNEAAFLKTNIREKQAYRFKVIKCDPRNSIIIGFAPVMAKFEGLMTYKFGGCNTDGRVFLKNNCIAQFEKIADGEELSMDFNSETKQVTYYKKGQRVGGYQIYGAVSCDVQPHRVRPFAQMVFPGDALELLD